MEHYHKGVNEDEPLTRDKIPIPNLPHDFLWMKVRGGSKIRNLLSHALNEFTNNGTKSVIWTGYGTSVGKTVTCAEIMKRELKNKLHQITKICYQYSNEYWEPNETDLTRLVVKKRLPMIHILLSLNELSKDQPGYQAPGERITYRNQYENKRHHYQNKGNQKKKKDQQTSRNEAKT